MEKVQGKLECEKSVNWLRLQIPKFELEPLGFAYLQLGPVIDENKRAVLCSDHNENLFTTVHRYSRIFIHYYVFSFFF